MITLDDSQKAVVGKGYQDHSIVIAGPGSGKTTTSVALIQGIEEQLDVPESRSVLFISFSRAAIRSALSTMADTVAALDLFIDGRTIDSLALEILQEFAPVDSDAAPDFSRRLKRATTLLKEHGEELTDDLCHVIVDEGQDILGSRQDFLLELLRQLPQDCGVTIFADPAQSIYQFLHQEDSPVSNEPGSSAGSAAWSTFMDELNEIADFQHTELVGQYRARSPLTKTLFGELSNCRRAKDTGEFVSNLDECQAVLNTLELDDLAEFLPQWKGTTAILTRYNAEAVQLFQFLKQRSVNVDIRLRRELRAEFPSWIGKWAVRSPGSSFQMSELREYLRSTSDSEVEDAVAIGLDVYLDGAMSWSELRSAAERIGPRPAAKQGSIIISTIHQAKGLEFDNVVVHSPEQFITRNYRDEFEPELLFVALTRARRRIQALDHRFTWTKRIQNRLVIPSPIPRKHPTAVCVLPSDVRRDRVIGNGQIQFLLSEVDPESSLEFRLHPASFQFPVYDCFIDGQIVATTTEEFGKNLAAIARGRSGHWPHLSPIPIDGVETIFPRGIEGGRPLLVPRSLGFSEISFKK